ncbi:MAG: hypothetical protein VX438_13600, partial [Planctomycetota bacterium]|nr:hypothetical protein [Planctomycetota bacterium]
PSASPNSSRAKKQLLKRCMVGVQEERFGPMGSQPYRTCIIRKCKYDVGDKKGFFEVNRYPLLLPVDSRFCGRRLKA